MRRKLITIAVSVGVALTALGGVFLASGSAHADTNDGNPGVEWCWPWQHCSGGGGGGGGGGGW